MTIEFYTYSKKVNSTAVPQIGSGTSYTNCVLKDETSILNPTILLTVSGMPLPTTAPVLFNYAYISKFSRYYFVNDWRYVNGVWEVALSVDYMGSWKSGIGSVSCYIERCSSTFDGNVMDTLYPTKTDFSIQSVSVATPWYNIAPSGGMYVIGTIAYQPAGAPNTIGAVTYYACTKAQLIAVLEFLFGNSIYTASNITEMGQGLYQSFFNPFQYVVSCIWFPEVSSAFGSSQATVKVGYWDTGIQAIAMDVITATHSATCTIPDHPQSSRGNYLNYAPYTKLTLYVPPFGCIPVDTRFRDIGNYLDCTIRVDHVTGEATLRVNISPTSTSHIYTNYITERTAMFGVPIQLAQVLNQYDIGGSLIGTGIGMALDAITSVIGTSVGSSINPSTPTVSTSGSNGSFLSVTNDSRLIVEHALLVDEDKNNQGRPLMDVRTISNIPGYIKAINPPVSLPVTEQETEWIKNTMESGFYYE